MLVSAGVFQGSGNVDLDTEGKAITIQGAGYLSTIIDCEGRARGFTFHCGETATTIVKSLTIKRGYNDIGGAVSVLNSSPVFSSCSIEDCTADTGGAVYISGGSPGFISTIFRRNNANLSGGGLYADSASLTLTACTFDGNGTKGAGGAVIMNGGSSEVDSTAFQNNTADQGGAGFYSVSCNTNFVNDSFCENTTFENGAAIDASGSSALVVSNCSIAANLSHRGAGGIQVSDSASAKVSNSILWSDSGAEYQGAVKFRYTCITGGAPGAGNIDDDPKLVDAIGEDLHLTVGSACIDKGDSKCLVAKLDQDGRPRTIGSSPDMGAYEYPIVKPIPHITTSSNEVFVVPHDGNPNTDTVVATIQGSGYDTLGGVLSYQWTVDNEVVGNSETLTIPLEPGTRIFVLQVRDAQGDFANDSVTVKVLPEPNAAPVASAGSDQTVTAKGATAHVFLHGNGYDPDGDPMTYRWSTGATTQDTAVDLAPGSYTFTFKATDPYGAVGTATVRIHVLDGSGPIVTLNGITPMNLEVFSPWVDPGANATDITDGGSLAITEYGTVDNTTLGTYKLTYTAKDNSGNTGSAVRIVNVVDTTGPVITLNGQNPMTVQCGKGYVEPGANAVDAVDGPVPVTISGPVASAKGTYTVTYSASDKSGNKSTATRTVSVVDTSPPVITLNGDNPMSVECGKGYSEPGAYASDSCDGTSVPVVISGTVSSTPGTYTITYTATDSSGNVATATRTVTVADTTAPVITLNGDNPMTVECGKGYTEPGATAKDSCDTNPITVTISGSVASTPGTYTITYTTVDKTGNKATKTRTVVVADTAAPVITLKGANPMTVECGQGYVEPGATAKDTCDGSSDTVTISGTVSTVKGTYTMTYTAIDTAGNKATTTRTVNVTDTTPPVLTLNGSPSVTVECGSGYTELGATAMDICDGVVMVKTSGTVSSAPGSYTVTYTATDSSGNKATATRTITVSDSTPPTITLKGANPMSVECATGYVEPGATATDSCDVGGIPVVITGVVPTTKGTYTVTYTATDSSGNKATATRAVIVSDSKAPVITLNGPNPVVVECSKGYVELGATAIDSCEGSLPVTISGSVLTGKGTYTVTYSATDSSGNKATATRTVNVADTTAPVITLNGLNPMTVACGSGYTEPGASATDGCDGAVPVTVSGAVLSAKGTYVITYTATDSSGNSASTARTVNVTNTTPPIITLNGANPMTVQCGAGYSEPGATAVDSCNSGSVPVVITGTVSSAKGTYTVTYSATDSAGNVATATRTVRVVDTTAPVITLKGSNPMTVECGAGYVELGATVADTCDSSPVLVITGTVLTSKGTYVVTYKATDASGNTATATRTVNVVDTKAPVITLHGSNPMTVQCGSGYVEPGATATDACDGSATVTITGTVLTSKGRYTVTYKATDSSSNTATTTRTVNVVDTTPPVITLNGANPITVACGSGYTEPGATANDACDGGVTVVITGSVLTSKGTYTVTYKATDSSGNTATVTRTVNVVDTTAPVITLKGSNPMTITLPSVYAEPGASAADACDGTLAVVISGSVPSVVGTYTVTYTATDSSGNKATATRTVVVVAPAGPVISAISASPPALNSGNQKMKLIKLTYTVTDASDPAPTITVTATSSDPDSGMFTGDLPGDIVVNSTTSVSLRDEHAPGLTRTYTITVKVTDKYGSTTSGVVTVICS